MVSERQRSFGSIGNRIDYIEGKTEASRNQGPNIGENAITSTELDENSVTSSALAPNSVDSVALGGGAVGTENLGVVNKIKSEDALLLSGAGYIPRSDNNPVRRGLIMDPDGIIRANGSQGFIGVVTPLSTGYPIEIKLNTGETVYATSWFPGYNSRPYDKVYIQYIPGSMSTNGLVAYLGTWHIVSLVKNTPYFNTKLSFVYSASPELGPPDLPTYSAPMNSSVASIYNELWGDGYTKSSDGVVVFDALISINTGMNTTGRVFATMPVGFRPLRDTYFPSSNSGVVRRILVKTDGTMSLAGSGWTAGGFTSLANIVYPTAPGGPAVPDPAFQETTYQSGTRAISSFSNGWTANPTTPPQIFFDRYGFVWPQGAVNSGTVADSTQMMTLPAGFPQGTSTTSSVAHPGTAAYLMGTSGTAGTMAGYRTSNGTPMFMVTPGSAGPLYMDGMTWQTASTTRNYWRPMTLLNSWTRFGASYYDAEFYKRPDGLVCLRGMVTGGLNQTFITNLPPEYRPAKRVLRMVANANGTGRIDIYPNGDVAAATYTSPWISLDGIVFSADQ